MERIMLWWDDLDDALAAVRHVLRAACTELLSVPPLPTWGTLIGQWLHLPA